MFFPLFSNQNIQSGVEDIGQCYFWGKYEKEKKKKGKHLKEKEERGNKNEKYILYTTSVMQPILFISAAVPVL
jgi:hypothetical protein